MPFATRKPSHSKLYQNDVVQKVSSPDSIALVSRCWHDPEDIPPQVALADPLLRPLKQGEVGISYIAHGEGKEIIHKSELKLIDRTLQPGDYCKRSVDDVRSGVVTAVRVKGRLEHVISGEPVPGWKTAEDLEDRHNAEVGDYVVSDDWIGQIIEVFDEAIIEVSNGRLVRLPELGSRLAAGDEGTNILPPPPQNGVQTAIRSLFGSTAHNQDSKDRVISVKHSVYAVAWLALSQTLDNADAEKRFRPRRLWCGSDLGNLTLIRGKSDMEMRVGDRVSLKDNTGLPMTEHGNEREPAGIVHVQTFKVSETVTTLDVLWQDGVRETVRSIDVIPYISPDEYDCWPGDHVLWRNEGEERFAIVQSVNPTDRTAKLLFKDTGTQELVSLLELDSNGTSLDDAQFTPDDGFGVRRGDFVFIHPEGSTNGMKWPRVPRLGELQPWVREVPFADGQYHGWRKEMSELGTSIAASRRSSDCKIKRPTPGTDDLHWIGEVTELRLDGTIEVTHPDWTVKLYPLERLTRLYDGMEQLDDDPWVDDGASDEYIDDLDHFWAMDEDDDWQDEEVISPGHWVKAYDDEGPISEDEEEHMDVDSVHSNELDVPATGETTQSTTPEILSTIAEANIAHEDLKVSNTESLSGQSGSAPLPMPQASKRWKRFDVLTCAPVDHAFYSTVPGQPSRAFLGRLSREYKALANGLPDSIIVRAFEDRTDLLRSLIIGPENTPYEDAPFVIDWMLDSNFPQSPPVAHFLSWTNGNGRVNPNLYEEGKVCLSILGTWAGDQSESWNPSRSSLLQAFVSIQGLVLVKEPWFCEPAFDKLRGTQEGKINSRLYSEKAFVLSRGFIRRALEIPLGGLEEEIDWIYYAGGCLEKVLRQCRKLIESSTSSPDVSPEDQDLAIPRLTAGGIITLERTLNKLQDFYDHRQSSSSSTI